MLKTEIFLWMQLLNVVLLEFSTNCLFCTFNTKIRYFFYCPFFIDFLMSLIFMFYSKVFPIVYVLMTRKTTLAYKHIFRFINEKVCSLACHSFTTDYECAMRNALKELFPETRMVACWFHYSQALKKRAAQIPGFVRFLSGDQECELIYYKLQCLPLLPAEHILNAFNELKRKAKSINKDKFKPFLSYFERQWIRKVSI